MAITPFPIPNGDPESARRSINHLISITEQRILKDIQMNRNNEANKDIVQLTNLICARISYDICIEITRDAMRHIELPSSRS